MTVSYILNKDELTLLCYLINGADSPVPKIFFSEIPEDGTEKIIGSLSDKGYIHLRNGMIDIERTINFLIGQIISVQKAELSEDGKRLILYCKKLILIIEEDRLSVKKCRLIPVKDPEMLSEYLSEATTKYDMEEEQL